LVGGEVESYTYDTNNRLQTKTNVLGTFAFGYLGQSHQLASRTTASSGTLNTPALLLTYDTNLYDRRLQRIQYAKNGTPGPTDLLWQGVYSYGTNSVLSKIDETSYAANGSPSSHKIWDVQYGATNQRLTTYAPAAGSDANTSWYEYEYDISGNRSAASLNGISQTIAVDEMDQMTVVRGKPATYDANGNLLRIGTGTTATVLTWDAENRLLSYKSGGFLGGTVTTFSYDGYGRRNTASGGGGNFRHLWCGTVICQTRNGSGYANVYATFFQEGVRFAGNSEIYVQDRLGSVRQFRPRNTTTVGTLEYGPYGELLRSPDNSLIPSEFFGYANMFQEGGAPVYYTMFRVYDQGVGRWESRDPIGVRGGPNVYAYVEDDPLGTIDPLGLWSMQLSFYDGIGGAINLAGTGFRFQSLSFKGGVGIGGGFSYNPWGGPPSEEPLCEATGIGLFGEATAGIGPVGGGLGWNWGGWQSVDDPHESGGYGGFEPELRGNKSFGGVPIHFGFDAEGEASAGVELTHFFEQPGCKCKK
jgi:RHS repeat-associated protein